jgi:hypothetical protein
VPEDNGDTVRDGPGAGGGPAGPPDPPGPTSQPGPPGRGLVYRGISYDTGCNFATGQGSISRLAWSTEQMRAEIDAIADGLHANSVTVFGTDLGRLAETVAAAVERGLHVWLQPRLVDRPQEETLDHLADGARLAESFRRQGADIRYSIGCVHYVMTPGIVPGEKYHERMANMFADAEHHFLKPTGSFDQDDATVRLNDFLGRAAAVARQNFRGELIYSAGRFENVDWSLLDYVGLTYYYTHHPTREGHAQEIGSYRRWGKPIVISEYGSPAYVGAADRGLLAFDVIDRAATPPTVFDGYLRNERAQADYHLRMLRMFEELGVHSVAIAEFIHPTHPHSTDPRYDLDIASWAITKTIRDDYADHASNYRWEPKEAFYAIGEYYAAARERERGAPAA